MDYGGNKSKVIEIGKRLHRLGLVASADGNISARRFEDFFLITGRGAALGFLTEDQIVEVDLEGKLVKPGPLEPSSETLMHAEIYRQRPDVGAVVHAHPPYAVAFSVAGLTYDWRIIPEAIYYLGPVAQVPYATPGTPDSTRAVKDFIRDHDVLLLARHGAVTMGRDLEDAYFKMEKLEHAAKTVFLAHQLGKPEPLPDDEVEMILEMRKISLKKK